MQKKQAIKLQETWGAKPCYHPAFAKEVPYVVALVELDEGPRLLTNIVGVNPESVTCEMPVKVVFDDVAEDVSVPKFEPA